MKLNLHILQEDLKDKIINARLPEKAYSLFLRYPVLCEELPQTPRDDILYLCTAPQREPTDSFEIAEAIAAEEKQQISPTPSPLTGYACFIGTPPEKWFQSNWYFLCFPRETDSCSLLNLLNSLFSKYQEWEESLQEVIDLRFPLEKLAERSKGFIKNPIFAQDAGFVTLFFYRPVMEHETDFYKEYKKLYPVPEDFVLDTDTINDMITDTGYINASASIEPALFQGKANRFRDLYYNVRIDGMYAARIFIDEVISPLTGKDFAMIKIIGLYLKKGLENQVYRYTQFYESESIISELLQHHLLPEVKIQTLLTSLKWNMNDAYICTVIRSKASENACPALHSIAYHIKRKFEQSVCAVFQNAIVALFNLSAARLNRSELESPLLPFLRDNFLSCAVSLTFYDFKNLYYHYRQTLITEKVGNQKDPTKWFFRTEDYHIDCIIEKCATGSLYDTLVPDALADLLSYDKKHQTDYASLLRIYLEHDRSIMETSRCAYIHRNTCLYRIKRIQELLPINLSISENRTLLHLAFLALDHKNT